MSHLFALASWFDVVVIGNESGANVLIVLLRLFQLMVELVITEPNKSKGKCDGKSKFLVTVHTATLSRTLSICAYQVPLSVSTT